jgi:hypothetical protein
LALSITGKAPAEAAGEVERDVIPDKGHHNQRRTKRRNAMADLKCPVVVEGESGITTLVEPPYSLSVVEKAFDSCPP